MTEPYYEHERVQEVEAQLRTLMLAGIEPAELEADILAKEKAIMG